MSLVNQLRQNLQEMLERKRGYDNAAADISQALRDARAALGGEEPASPRTQPRKLNVKGNDTIRERVQSIMKGSKVPLGGDEIAIKLIEGGYKSSLDESALMEHVYTEGIQPLLRAGLAEAMGEIPNRKYRLKK